MTRRKATRFVRIRADFVVEFKEPSDSLPMGGDKDYELIADSLFKALEKLAKKRGIIGMACPRLAFSMDRRPRDEDGVLIGK